jgi:hypothetical protein
MKNAIVLALLRMRMVAEEIVKEEEGISRRFAQTPADQQGCSKRKSAVQSLHRAPIFTCCLKA